MPKETKKLENIKRIFKQNIPLLLVSKSLLNDIEAFVEVENISAIVIPNVIDSKYFYYQERMPNKYITFFSLNEWRAIKNPFPMLEGFRLLYQKNKKFKLVLGGYGELLDEMKAFVLRYHMSKNIIFIGRMDKREVANEMSKSDAYLISSKYETFSVVCAESLLSGTPIIGTYLSAVAEYAPKNSYLSFKDNIPQRWLESLEYFINNQEKYNKKRIASIVSKTLDNTAIKSVYKEVLLHEF